MHETDDSATNLKGHFLIAMPGLNDPNFSQTVVCMCEYNSQGSFGIVINRTYPSLNAKIIFDELNIQYTDNNVEEIPIYYGGPVHLNELFILHEAPLEWEASLIVTPALAMTNTRDLLEAIAAGEGPEDYLIALGCSGWGPNQLEAEMKENAWLSTPVSRDILFESFLDDRWEDAVRQMGINPVLLTDIAGHA